MGNIQETVEVLVKGLATVTDDVSALKPMVALLGGRQIQIVAGEILKHVANVYNKQNQSRSSKLFNGVGKSLLERAGKIHGMAARDFQIFANEVVTDINSSVHEFSIVQLDAAVKDTKDSAILIPEIRKKYFKACMVVDKYDDYKKAFPKQFGGNISAPTPATANHSAPTPAAASPISGPTPGTANPKKVRNRWWKKKVSKKVSPSTM